MSLTEPNAESPDEDYNRIEHAVLETERGRWFLREFARRQRIQETQTLLESIGRIERVLSDASPALAGDLAAEHHVQALAERSARLDEIAWTLRERGYDGAICAMIEREARAIAALAGHLDGTGPLLDLDDSAQADEARCDIEADGEAEGQPMALVAGPVASAND